MEIATDKESLINRGEWFASLRWLRQQNKEITDQNFHVFTVEKFTSNLCYISYMLHIPRKDP